MNSTAERHAQPLSTDVPAGLPQTAWLTVFCHHACGDAWGLKRPVSEWLLARLGSPAFAARLSAYTRHGIAARAVWFDRQIDVLLQEAAVRGERVDIWVLGAGLDSRWQWILDQHADQVESYREFDYMSLLTMKDRLLHGSPWHDTWRKVTMHGADLGQDPGNILPQGTGRVIVVAEGLLDYFDEQGKRALIRAIVRNTTHASVLLDAQSSWLLSRNNRNPAGSTGADELTYGWAPACPIRFYDGLEGLAVRAHEPLLPALLKKRFPLISLIPMPRLIRNAYNLLLLETTGQ